jgi:TetR/AcrR family transcriptional regulator, transcriptional repressor for nem operon
MGHSRAQKDQHHDRIVGVAAARFREDGVERVGVAELMHDVGLTHGGFYRHFGSREDLVAEAVERALHDGGQAMTAVADSADEPLTAVIDAYLSTSHRDDLGTSCAVTTLAGDVARSNPRARTAYTSQVLAYVDLLIRLLPQGPTKGRRSAAIMALATLVGAVSMARAVNDEALSREILTSTAAELKAQLG